ncbi:MAG TPA: MBL fold metallo-hydrolase [Candidatus Eremiobacteraeota bacterium]|nr:MAG: Ribonuclease BN [bacterium ADurb.Bin363]HPZ09994.1 MBL fold metallo-hydrolase [Candidatus Eremiobacteraeota bacterium]
MSLINDVIDNLTGYSKAMYSTWFYYKAEKFLLDAGEGVSTSLGNKIFGIKKIFLSHGHYDHIGGLPGVILSRNSAMGDKTKPITIYYPKGDNFIELQKDYIKKCCYNLTYELNWYTLESNVEITLDTEVQNRFMRTFPTDHSRGHLTLGYNLIEKRTRLKKEFLDYPQSSIVKMVKEYGKSWITENYEHIILSYVGDSMPVSTDYVRGAEILMHEASFLDGQERKYNIHSTLEEALNVACEANVKSLILYHISSRYSWDEINRKLSFLMKKMDFFIPVFIIMSSHFRNYSASFRNLP